MSVIVKGIKPPGNCFLCPYKKHAGWVRCMFTDMNVEPETVRETKAKSCPIVEVPTHGRLIDADAIKFKYGIYDEYYEKIKMVSESDIEDMPTIIEAER